MRKRKSKKGFTLIELIVVIAIVAVVTAIAVPVFVGLVSNAQKTACAENMSNLLRSFEVQTTLDGGIETIQNDTQLSEKLTAVSTSYLSKELTTICPSGGTYSVHFTGENYQYTITCSKHTGESVTGNIPCTPENVGKVMQEIFGVGLGNAGTFEEAKSARGFDSEAGGNSWSAQAKDLFLQKGLADLDNYMWFYKKATGTFYIAEKSGISDSATTVTVKKYMTDGTITEETAEIQTHKNGYKVLVPDGRDPDWR